MQDVQFGETITTEWGNDIRDRTVQRYADSTARGVSVPTPADGDLSFLEDNGIVYVFFDGLWRPVGPVADGSVTTPKLADGSVTTPKLAGTTAAGFEVDGITEVESTDIGTTPAVEATVALVIPTGWVSWKCMAVATGSWALATEGALITYLLRINGTDQQEVVRIEPSGGESHTLAVVGNKAANTGTGSKSISLIASTSSGLGTLIDVSLYARAVRLT
jgi:hypothetical protein